MNVSECQRRAEDDIERIYCAVARATTHREQTKNDAAAALEAIAKAARERMLDVRRL